MTALIWFRKDLRIDNNPALTAACNENQSIIPLYIYDAATLHIGSAQQWWLHYSLTNLNQSLEVHDSSLCLKKGPFLDILKSIIQQENIKKVYWNECFEPTINQQDKKIKSMFVEQGIEVKTYNGFLLTNPEDIKNQSDEYFKVFTPFWRSALNKINPPKKQSITHWPTTTQLKSESLDAWNLLPKSPNWASEFSHYWQPGSEGAHQKLAEFIENGLKNYDTVRDLPAEEATSLLSPHLHFGEISPWDIWHEVNQLKGDPNYHTGSIERYCAELGWREFSYYLLHYFPQLPSENFQPKFNGFNWEKNQHALTRWQNGQTGYPIVDAGMRQLWKTGYMHNRVRMIVASFLTKDLLIDWRMGADWFMDTLLDADLANNAAGWQWVAGCGADAAPYFRIFNPTLQGEKFDPKGTYVRRWIPELEKVPEKWIHQPWKAIDKESPIPYPKPMIDHQLARKKALSRYQNLN